MYYAMLYSVIVIQLIVCFDIIVAICPISMLIILIGHAASFCR